MTQLARDNAIAKSTGYDHLYEGIDLLDAPDAQAGMIGRSSREPTRRLRRKRSSTWPHRGRDSKSASEINRTGPGDKLALAARRFAGALPRTGQRRTRSRRTRPFRNISLRTPWE